MSGYSVQELGWLGGHGAYVWGALALCIVAVLIEWKTLRQARKQALRRVQRLHQTKQGSQSNDGKTN